VTRILTPGETLDGYDVWAAQYDADANPMVAATAWALDRTPLGAAGADVLELGCGTGRNVARVLGERARRYVGVDGSAGMLEAARRACPDPCCPFALGELGAELPVAAASFDLALIVLVLEHLAELAAPLAGVRRALRDGGTLRIVEIHPALVAAGTVAHFPHDDGEVRFTSTAHPIASVRAALADAGFETVAVREHVADGALLAAVPRLAKHAGRPVLYDLEARAD
jgi:SAM-dependent methyltransferase